MLTGSSHLELAVDGKRFPGGESRARRGHSKKLGAKRPSSGHLEDRELPRPSEILSADSIAVAVDAGFVWRIRQVRQPPDDRDPKIDGPGDQGFVREFLRSELANR